MLKLIDRSVQTSLVRKFAGPGGSEYRKARKAMLLGFAQRLFVTAVVILIVFGMPVSASPLPTTQRQDSTTPDAANNQDMADQADIANNGTGLTRPQNSFETRLNDRTSSSPTSQTKRDTLILRLNSKITFDDGWKLATLAQIPLMAESTVTFDPWVRIMASASGVPFFKP